MTTMGTSEPTRPFDAVVSGRTLTVTIRRDFDSGNAAQDWAQQVQVMHPGPFEAVVVDCSGCGLLSSTFFAGIMQLHQFHSAALGARGARVVLDRPDPRIVRNLEILRLHPFFEIRPR
jgi:anti-anti-sigma regulatory factor